MPRFSSRILYCVFRIPLRRLLPIASALGLAFSLLWLLAAVTRPAQATGPQATDAATRYVIGAGGSDSADCLYPVPQPNFPTRAPCATIQRAIDLASAGDTIKVAQGTYNTLNTKGGLSQVVFVDKQVIVEGGYSGGFFGAPDFANPSVIDAGNGGRGIVIVGPAAATVRGFRVVNGNAEGLNGNGGGLLVSGGDGAISDNRGLAGGPGWRTCHRERFPDRQQRRLAAQQRHSERRRRVCRGRCYKYHQRGD